MVIGQLGLIRIIFLKVININISLSIIFDYIFDMLQTVQRMISWEDSSTRNSFPQHRL